MSFRRFCPDSGSTVRLPRLRGNHGSVADRLFVDEDPAGLFGFPANMLVAGHAFSACESGRRQNLHTVTDAENPLLPPIELAQDLDDFAVIAKILRRAAAQDEHGGVVVHLYVVE